MFGQPANPEQLIKRSLFRKRIAMTAGILTLVIIIMLVWVAKPWRVFQTATTKKQTSATQNKAQDITSFTGTTSLATLIQPLSFNPAGLDLIVESLQAKAGDKVEIASQILKITDASLTDARASLTTDVKIAQTAYDQASVDYQSKLAEISDQLNEDQNIPAIAKADYDIAIYDLQNTVSTTQKAMDKVHAIIANHPALVSEAKHALSDCDEDLDDAEDDLEDCQDELKVKQKAASDALDDIWDAIDSSADSSDLIDFKKVYHDKLDEIPDVEDAVSDNQKIVTNLKSEYSQRDSLVTTLESELDAADLSLAEIELACHQANLDLINKQIELKYTYQSSLVDYQNAKSAYNLAVQQAKGVYDEAQLALQTAKQQRSDFEADVGTGYLLARSAGTVSSMGYSAGDDLVYDTDPLNLINPDLVQVNVSVDQTAISKIHVGDAASVTLTGNRTSYEGQISSISPVSTSYTVSDVYYTVMIDLTGDVSSLTSDLDATVTFTSIQNALT